MKYGIYSVRDKLTGYLNISLERSDALAKRSFGIIVGDSDSVIGRNPGDYDLYRLGSFDTDSGDIHVDIPEFVVSASSLCYDEISSVKEDRR